MNFSHIEREQLPPFERMLTDEAVALFKRPVGPERSLTRRDHAGREVTEFYGADDACWRQFTNDYCNDGTYRGPMLGRINGKLFTGKNGQEARAQRAQLEARRAAGEAALRAQEARASA